MDVVGSLLTILLSPLQSMLSPIENGLVIV